MTSDAPSLFDRIGGAPAVEQLLAAFYTRMLDDPELAPFFENTSMEQLQKLQRAFFATALGGPSPYEGPPLREVHRGMGINLRHLARFVDHLLAVLRERGIGRRDAVAIIDRISAHADEITGQAIR